MELRNDIPASNDNDHFIKKSFRSYLIPSILAILTGNISIMVDNCVAGAALGENALAAMGIVNPIFNAITGFGLLICGGASALASISIGQGNIEKKQRFFSIAFYMIIGVSAIITALGLAFLDPIVRALGATGDMYIPVKDYARTIICSSFTIMCVFFPLNFFRIEGKAKVAMTMFFIMSGLDIVLDLVFVLVVPWGMTGLALATGLSSLIAVICVFPSLFSKQMGYRLVKVRDVLPDALKTISTGSPLALSNLYCVIRVRIINSLLISFGGSLALAAYGCANSVNNIGMAVVTGVVNTVGPIVGVLYGERDKEGIKHTMSFALKFGCLVTTVLWIGIVIFRAQLAAIFGLSSPEQMYTAGLAISVLNFSLISSTFAEIFIYYYLTTQRIALSNLITVSEGLIFKVILAYAGARLYGFVGLMAGLALSEIFSVISALIAATFKKKKENCDSILLLPGNLFDYGSYLSKTVLPVSENISETAQMAEVFCCEHGLTPKQAMTVSLGIEEIMVLMSQYALKKPDEYMEFRLFISEYETVLRLRCGGKWFNPLNYDTEDELDNLGVKMLLKMATDISYSTNLGMNNVKIVISAKNGEKDKK